MLSRWLLIALFCALLVWAVLFSSQSRPPAATAFREQPSDVDYFLEGTEIVATDASGQPEFRLHADTMHHFTTGDRIELENPYIIGFENSERIYELRARRGQGEFASETLTLEGNVELDRQTGDGEIIAMRTSTLALDRRSGIAETDTNVVITAPSVTLYATGLTADLNTGRLRLYHNVKGFAEVPQP